MDTSLLIVLLAVALIAIVALPNLFRRKTDDGTAPSPDSPRANTRASKPAKMATLEDSHSQSLTRWLCEQVSTQTGIDVTRDPMALSRIADAAKKAQDETDANGHAEILLPYIAAIASGPKHFQLKVTREQLASARNRMM
jgi:hypothetical protein